MSTRSVRGILLAAIFCATACAHVGSPDIYLDANAGPYRLFVTVRPPLVIPGVATLEVRSETPGVRQIRAVPIPMRGAGAQFAPVADALKVSATDSQFFTGSLWMMAPGSWRMRLTAAGDRGDGTVWVPVPAAALTTRKMQTSLGLLLAMLGIFLAAALVAIVGASTREAKLESGAAPDTKQKARARIAMSIGALIVIALVWYGDAWWNREAFSYGEKVYKPLEMKATLDRSGILTLRLHDPGWLRPRPGAWKMVPVVRTIDDLIPDHDHLMHLYAIRQPDLDVVFHLHPELVDTGIFQLKLPGMPAGTYTLYADIVHANGFPETMVTTLPLPAAIKGRTLAGDDASAVAAPWWQASTSRNAFLLPDGYRMEWLRGTGILYARQATTFRFRLLDQQGRPPGDMQFYMGMLGHAAFVKTDGTVFAHIHPTGSISMAAFMLAQNQTTHTSANMSGMDMSGMDAPPGATGALPNEVGFPYGFPSPGRYRIFVQMKHGGMIETGVFDAEVT